MKNKIAVKGGLYGTLVWFLGMLVFSGLTLAGEVLLGVFILFPFVAVPFSFMAWGFYGCEFNGSGASCILEFVLGLILNMILFAVVGYLIGLYKSKKKDILVK